MGALESNTTLVYGVHLRESANDGSDFSNAASDYRVLFLGEDGYLHVKDSAGAVADPYPASASALPVFPTIVNYHENAYTSGTSIPLSVNAPTAGNRLVAIIGSTGRVCNSITQTNVTWTQRLTSNGNSKYVEIWTGVVASTGGTTATAAFTGTNDCAMTYIELPSTAPAFATAGTPVVATAASGTVYTLHEPVNTTLGDYYIWGITAGQASSYSMMNQSYVPFQGGTGGFFRCGMLRSHGGPLALTSINVASNAYRAVLVKLS